MDQLPGICCDAATRLFRWAKVHVAYAYKLEENLTSLRGKWCQLDNIRKDVQTRIEEAESMGDMLRTYEVNGWLQDVLNLQQVYREQIDDQGSQESRNKCPGGYCPRNCMSSYKLGKKVVKMGTDVDQLLNRRKDFDKDVGITYKPQLKVMDEVPCGETVGLDLMLNKVWNSLQDQSVCIIGLYGMGGAGKTTLMKRIRSEFGKTFELVLWVVVSKDCNINKVMNDIYIGAGIKDENWEKSSEHHKAAKIYRVLSKKRFVLMLDDLWGKLELESVGVPVHPKGTSCESKVVLTTRFEDVCDKMQAQNKFKVECLLEKEAFDLFCKKVGEETLKSHGEIPALAREMAKECGGLPLAIITVGSAMAGVKSVDAWRQAKRDLSSSPWIATDLQDKVFRILEFSYDRLPDETHQHCFLYCALYPEDYSVYIEDLIDRWIGEGFLDKDKYKSRKKKSIYDMREEGKSIIEKLKLSCLLEDATSHDTIWRSAIKMHDVIRDMALWLGRDQDKNKDKVVVEGEASAMDDFEERLNDNVERISVIGVQGRWQHVPTCPNLFTLCIQREWNIANFSNLQYMTRLKVLDLSYNWHIQHLPVEVGKLINLEFLNLSVTSMSNKLPIELKNLKKLRVFLVEVALDGLQMFPLEVLESLKQLKVFRYSHKRVQEEEEEEEEEEELMLLDKLECLPELEELGIRLSTITGLNKLLNSAKLQGCLRNLWLTEIKEPLEMASLLAVWSRMKHLECVVLRRLNLIMEVSSIVDTICHLGQLLEVRIYDCKSITHLTWLRYAPLLEILSVEYCNSMEEVVKEAQDENLSTELFSNLRYLHLSHLSKLKSINQRALPFPSLNVIHIWECNGLRKLPLNSNSAKDTLIEIQVSTSWWTKLEWEDPATEHLLRSKLRLFD